MIERMWYGHQESRIYVDIPQDIFDVAMAETKYLAKIIEFRAQQRVVEVESLDGGRRLLLNAKRAGNIKSDFVKEDRAKQMVYALAAVASHSLENQLDPNLTVDMGVNRLGDGERLGMTAFVTWPARPESEVQTTATSAMRQTASELSYISPASLIAGSVYAQLDRRHGVSLQTDLMGSCDIGTNGMFYKPESPVIELNAHNLYSHSMQLICLSGLIAIARA